MEHSADLEKQLSELAQQANKYERIHAEAESIFRDLESLKHDFFASVVDKQAGKSTAEKERKARLSEDWKVWMCDFRNAQSNFIRSRADRNCAVRNWETCRSELSSSKVYRTTGL